MIHTITTIGAAITLQVYAEDYYSRHSLQVNPGEAYHIEVLPNQYWTDWFHKSDASGFWNPLAQLWGMRVKKTKCFTLCGAYDKSDQNAFPIGLQRDIEITQKQPSELFFFANDSKNYYGNNRDSITIRISRTR